MQREAPDSDFYAALRDLNMEFLKLLTRCRQQDGIVLFGLAPVIRTQLMQLESASLESIAAMPCLLADMPGLSLRDLERAAEPAPDPEPSCLADSGVFIAGLLTYVSQVSQRDPLRAALCSGPSLGQLISRLRFRDIHAVARCAQARLQARFCGHPHFWPDLINAARDGSSRRLELSRLAAIQLTVAERASVRRTGSARLPGFR